MDALAFEELDRGDGRIQGGKRRGREYGPHDCEPFAYLRAGGGVGHNHRDELWGDAGDKHGDVQRDADDADELECHERCRAGAERGDHRERGGDGWWRGQQRGGLYGGGAAEHHELESDFRAGGHSGNDYRSELWGDAGNEHGDVRRRYSNADEL